MTLAPIGCNCDLSGFSLRKGKYAFKAQYKANWQTLQGYDRSKVAQSAALRLGSAATMNRRFTTNSATERNEKRQEIERFGFGGVRQNPAGTDPVTKLDNCILTGVFA